MRTLTAKVGWMGQQVMASVLIARGVLAVAAEWRRIAHLALPRYRPRHDTAIRHPREL